MGVRADRTPYAAAQAQGPRGGGDALGRDHEDGRGPGHRQSVTMRLPSFRLLLF
jgi:hypothetical protein